mmetsp:Transcript_8055/g.28243  ORF Transcript_8055/g.28243 Transcript_8055/m.28243 type:complete len:562 (-) Transcript_8055:330-2015(-)
MHSRPEACCADDVFTAVLPHDSCCDTFTTASCVAAGVRHATLPAGSASSVVTGPAWTAAQAQVSVMDVDGAAAGTEKHATPPPSVATRSSSGACQVSAAMPPQSTSAFATTEKGFRADAEQSIIKTPFSSQHPTAKSNPTSNATAVAAPWKSCTSASSTMSSMEPCAARAARPQCTRDTPPVTRPTASKASECAAAREVMAISWPLSDSSSFFAAASSDAGRSASAAAAGAAQKRCLPRRLPAGNCHTSKSPSKPAVTSSASPATCTAANAVTGAAWRSEMRLGGGSSRGASSNVPDRSTVYIVPPAVPSSSWSYAGEAAHAEMCLNLGMRAMGTCASCGNEIVASTESNRCLPTQRIVASLYVARTWSGKSISAVHAASLRSGIENVREIVPSDALYSTIVPRALATNKTPTSQHVAKTCAASTAAAVDGGAAAQSSSSSSSSVASVAATAGAAALQKSSAVPSFDRLVRKNATPSRPHTARTSALDGSKEANESENGASLNRSHLATTAAEATAQTTTLRSMAATAQRRSAACENARSENSSTTPAPSNARWSRSATAG